MNDPSIRDQHLDLVALLQKKDQAVKKDEVYSIQDEIKNCAKYLHDHSLNNDGHRLDAAFAYYVAGYYVRAIRLISEADSSEDVHPAQRWLALILSKEFEVIEGRAKLVMGDAKYSDSELADEITSCGLSDYEALDRILCRKLAEAMLAFVEFAHFGDESKLNECYDLLRVSGRLCCAARESVWWWWIECIRLVVREYSENCLWTQLSSMRQENDPMVRRFIIANYDRCNPDGKRVPVVELWRTQVKSLPSINDPERGSFCLAIPTSGGKTRVAEMAILRFLIDYQNDPEAKCVYIAPFRALGNNVESEIGPTLSAAISDSAAEPGLGVVSSFYGGLEFDPLDLDYLTTAKVLIVTPEKLDGMLRSDESLRSQIKLVIADEGHLIGEGDTRGYRYRMLLERLACWLVLKDTSAKQRKGRLLFVSGVLPNAGEFAELLTGDKSNLVQIKWGPLPKPEIGRWTWDGRRLNTDRPSLPTPNRLNPLQDCSSPNSFEEVLVRTAFAVAKYENVLVFSASKTAIKSSTLLALLDCLSAKDPIICEENIQPLPTELIKRCKGKEWEKYCSILERGIAIHHADLPSDLKKETDERIHNGQVKLLISSPTHAQGVNLKFGTAIIYRLHHYYPVNQYGYPPRPINASTFWNVVGRVGRPVEANAPSDQKLIPPRVVFLINGSNASREDRADNDLSKRLEGTQARYRIATPFLEFLIEVRKQWKLNSGKDVADLFITLAEMPDLGWMPESETRSSVTELLYELDKHLNALMEEGNVGDEKVDEWLQVDLARVIDLLTGATSINPEDLEFIKLAVRARASFVAKNISSKQRKQDYLLGLPFKDCEIIRAKEESLLDWYQGCVEIFAQGRFDLGVASLAEILSFIISNLSICENAKNKRGMSLKPSDTGPLLQLETQGLRNSFFKRWILGEDVQTVTEVFQRLNNKADFEDYRETMLERELPWGVRRSADISILWLKRREYA